MFVKDNPAPNRTTTSPSATITIKRCNADQGGNLFLENSHDPARGTLLMDVQFIDTLLERPGHWKDRGL